MRSVGQIYAEAVATRNSYLQLTELDSGRSNSKLSILNLLTYVVAVCIHTYEALLDVFQVKIAEVLNGRINGTPDWYVKMARKFQYNPVTQVGDELRFNDDTMKVEYVALDPTHRIIEKAAWQTDEGGQAMVLKVCKANDDDGKQKGVPYIPLSSLELTAFRMFIQQIKFVGASIYCESLPGDIVTIIADEESPIYYDAEYITAEQAMANIQSTMVNYVNEIVFNDILYYQGVIDILQKAEHITDVGRGIKVMVSSYNPYQERYEEPVELVGRMRLRSGYAVVVDSNGIGTINEDNIKLRTR